VIFILVRVIDGRSRAFAVLWVDHVAQTHEPQSDRMLQECIIHSLVDDDLTEIWETRISETMTKYRTVDTLNLVVMLILEAC